MPLSDTLLHAAARDGLELDERWSFVGSRLHTACRVWTALCRQLRRIVAYFVGDRSADRARARRERIPADHRCRATRIDSWLADDEVFPRRIHRSTGKGAGETCHVERRNCTLHPRRGRFVRETLSLTQARPDARSYFAPVHHHNLSII